MQTLSRPLKIQNHRQSGTTERACQLCRKIFTSGEPSYSVNDSFWHINCFRCSQCLERISVDETFYELSKRLYCEHDYLTLYMPICTKCNKYVIGKVIRSMNMSFHENCFKCEFCDEVLSNNGAYRHEDKVICYDCSHRIQRKRIYYCEKCKHPIEEEEVLIIKSNPYHCYHFNCTHCKAPLTKSGRQRKDMPLCPRCYDRTCYTCFSCKLVIDPQTERSVVALDKHWHIDHFRCTMCRNVLHSKEFFEKKGLPYCKTHILEINGIVCFLCGLHPKGDFIDIFHKRFCQNCYRCRLCDRYLSHSDKVYENDMLPICRKCMKVKNVKQFILEKRH